MLKPLKGREIQAANDNRPLHDISGGMDGCRVWRMRPNGGRVLVGEYPNATIALREASRLEYETIVAGVRS